MRVKTTLVLAFAIPLLLSARLNAWTGPAARIRFETPQKATIEGQILRVQDDRLAVRILQSSDKKKVVLGEQSFARAEVSKLSLRREKVDARQKGLVIGTLLGGGLGAVSALIWGAGGYLSGRSLDRARTPVVIVP